MSRELSLYVRLPNWVGDVCMALPCLTALTQTGLPVTVCARPWARDLLAGMGKIDFVPMNGKVWGDRGQVAAHRRSHSGEAVGVLLPDSLSSALVFRLGGVPSAGYRDDGRAMLLRWPIAKPTQAVHAVQSWFGLTQRALAAWGLIAPDAIDQPPAPTLGLQLTPGHLAQARGVLANAQLSSGDFVLIAPTATGLHKGQVKVWPHFDGLTRALQAQGIKVVCSVPPAEQEQARINAPTAQMLEPVSLGAFAALTQAATLVICNDSGVSHVAAAVNARQLTLFGVTSSARTGPWSPGAHCLGHEGHWPELSEVVETTLTLLREENARAGAGGAAGGADIGVDTR